MDLDRMTRLVERKLGKDEAEVRFSRIEASVTLIDKDHSKFVKSFNRLEV